MCLSSSSSAICHPWPTVLIAKEDKKTYHVWKKHLTERIFFLGFCIRDPKSRSLIGFLYNMPFTCLTIIETWILTCKLIFWCIWMGSYPKENQDHVQNVAGYPEWAFGDLHVAQDVPSPISAQDDHIFHLGELT